MEKEEYTKKCEKYLIHLLNCALEDRVPSEKPKSLKWEDIFLLSNYHSVANTVCYAVEKLENKPKEELWMKWQEIKNKALVKNLLLEREEQEIIRSLSEEKICHMPLKGAVIKKYYPKPDMRLMADLDILIYPEDAQRVQKLMENLGYTCKQFNRSHHDIYLKSPVYNVEIHRELIPVRMSKLHYYYQDVFKRARENKKQPYLYEMSWEEFYVFLIVHLYKHYNNSGSGIRSIMDIYIFCKNFGDKVSWKKIRNRLEKLELLEFNQDMELLASHWFVRPKTDEKSLEKIKKLEKYIFASGTYGTREHFLDNQIQKRGKLGYFLYRTFLPYESMRSSFPILDRIPVLLPVCWIIRLGKASIAKREKVKYQVLEILNR